MGHDSGSLVCERWARNLLKAVSFAACAPKRTPAVVAVMKELGERDDRKEKGVVTPVHMPSQDTSESKKRPRAAADEWTEKKIDTWTVFFSCPINFTAMFVDVVSDHTLEPQSNVRARTR